MRRRNSVSSPRRSASRSPTGHRCRDRRPEPDEVDSGAVKAVLPYGNGTVKVVPGGLDIPKPDGDGVTILANAAVIISFDMERKGEGA